MTGRIARLVFALAATLLGACAGVDPAVYADGKPALALERYFNGTLDGYGMVQDRGGRVLRRFHVVVEARWEAGSATLDERFEWSDGERQRRVWTIRPAGAGRWTGSAPDVVGEAHGTVSGNALNWKYVLAVPIDGSVWNLDFDDWMHLIDDRVMLNRATMSKFGVRVGEVTLSFTRR